MNELQKWAIGILLVIFNVYEGLPVFLLLIGGADVGRYLLDR